MSLTRRLAALGLLATVAGCSGGGHKSSTTGTATATDTAGATPAPAQTTTRHPSLDWSRFGYDAERSGRAPRGPSAAQVARLSARQVSLPGTVDSSPIYLSGVSVHGRSRNLLVVTTTYGRTLGLDPVSGSALWSFTPGSAAKLAGSAQFTTATPVADPNGRYVYAASPDGFIHKLRVSNGRELTSGSWPASVTRDATHEKIASALNLDGRYVIVTTGGYIGDAPPYQGKVVTIDRTSGRILHVLNSLCSNRREIIQPSTCNGSDSAIWGRAGAVVDPKTHDLYATSSNGPFDGGTNWSDSVLRLSPGAATLLAHYTPSNQRELESTDADLGSTSPILLPDPNSGQVDFLLQGGKDSTLRLLDISKSLFGVTGSAGRRLGGEVQSLPLPGGDQTMFTAGAVLHASGKTEVFVATNGGTAAYRFAAGRLQKLWDNDNGGTSPVIAGSLLWVYDPGGGLNVYRPDSGKLVRHFDTPSGHWNSPIVAGGRVYVPTGNANDHSSSGQLTILR
ncbi:MAG TPA: PQQ-binding-like beta-propeller repeat protein [Thermoleophilaceae bacterium]|nr:PQQ-binding-like beta-propeller repeat protein [Thermoleophilaceae bacterium]